MEDQGKRDYPDEKMSWSFRVGGKFNSNPEITDVVYLGIFRSNLDHRAPMLQWLKNSTLDLKVQFSKRSGKAVRQEFVIGRKFPIESEVIRLHSMPVWCGKAPTSTRGRSGIAAKIR